MSFPSITHVALTVSNLGASIAWYSRLFGSDPVLEQDENSFRSAVWLEPLIGLHQHVEPTEGTFDEKRPGLDHVAFGVNARSELDAWEKRLDDLKIRHGGIVDAPYGSGLSFRDDDGIALEFFWMAS